MSPRRGQAGGSYGTAAQQVIGVATLLANKKIIYAQEFSDTENGGNPFSLLWRVYIVQLIDHSQLACVELCAESCQDGEASLPWVMLVPVAACLLQGCFLGEKILEREHSIDVWANQPGQYTFLVC